MPGRQPPTVLILNIGPTLLATLIAFGVGYLVIMWFLKLVSTKSFAPFVWYRLVLAALVAVALLTGVLEPMAGIAG